jgi:hypothetical protein
MSTYSSASGALCLAVVRPDNPARGIAFVVQTGKKGRIIGGQYDCSMMRPRSRRVGGDRDYSCSAINSGPLLRVLFTAVLTG